MKEKSLYFSNLYLKPSKFETMIKYKEKDEDY